MARGRGKFSFPLPGKKASKKTDHDTDDAASIPSVRSAHEWPSRLDEPTSKAHRILGTSEPIHRSVSRQTSGVPASPGFVSVSVSEASFGSDLEHKSSRAMTDLRPAISRRASSNIMGYAYSGDERRGSDYSTTTHRLQPQTSNSTMRSHYDAKSSPLAISQQTSDSAVRDMALRRGKPKVVADYGYSAYVASPLSPVAMEQAKERTNRKGKPARLDLSKLFPKPKTGDSQSNSNALLSPNKLVSSPAAMSTMSDFPFPRPMTREPTPNPRGNVKLKPTSRPHTSVPPTPSSPVRKFKRDEYDNAKVHVRRPPKGVQHWFDALDEDSDEVTEENNTPLYAPQAMRPPHIPIRKASAGRLAEVAMMSQPSSRPPRSVPLMPRERGDTFSHDDLVNMERLTSPSQYSLASNKTKESALSRTNLQDSSVLSFSSSEDEADAGMSKTRKVAVRKSLDNYDAGEIIIGQAQAFEVRPHRRPSAAQMSTRSTSTSAATIEVMYTPEPPFTPMHYPRYSTSTSRRSSHHRQPSVIHEDEDARPMTAVNMPLSPSSHSVRSARTSTSEPKPRSNNGKQKMMAVTAEEEMLLELMRKKRASMAKKGLTQEDMVAMEQDKLQITPAQSSRKPYRTSGFLAEASPVRVVDTASTRKSAAVPPSPLHLAPRGRPRKAHYDSTPRESSTSDAWSDHHSSPARHSTLPPHLPTPSEFSPIDLYPPSSPTPTASVTSPTTTDHASPLPSPVTPGLRAYENDVNVKVASSDTSTENEEVTVLDTGVIDAPALDSIKSSDSTCSLPQHTRRRTASSGTDVSFPIPPTTGLTDLPPVSEGSASRASSIMEQAAAPRPPRRNSRRVNDLAKATARPRSRQSSTHSAHSQQSLVSHTSSYVQGVSDKRTSKRVSRQSSATSMNNKRNSVSDDVLAAWGSLGGTY